MALYEILIVKIVRKNLRHKNFIVPARFQKTIEGNLYIGIVKFYEHFILKLLLMSIRLK